MGFIENGRGIVIPIFQNPVIESASAGGVSQGILGRRIVELSSELKTRTSVGDYPLPINTSDLEFSIRASCGEME